jgi:hypothetical protein
MIFTEAAVDVNSCNLGVLTHYFSLGSLAYFGSVLDHLASAIALGFGTGCRGCNGLNQPSRFPVKTLSRSGDSPEA